MASSPDLDEIAAGSDSDIWSPLIAQYNHRVVVSLLARGIPIDRAKDLAQETWLKLIAKHRAGQLPRLELPGLAITQAGFLALDERRSVRATRETPLPETLAVELRDESPGAEQRLLGHEKLHRAKVALAAMSPSARRVFQLVYDDPEISHAQAARETGLSLQRVRQIICEVRSRLRATLEHDHD